MKYVLVKQHPQNPELPIGFEIGWNEYENGYTGKVSHWFSQIEIEENVDSIWNKI